MILKKVIIISLLATFSIGVVAQKAFVPDEFGYVNDHNFHELIKERKYQLVGSFATVQENPTIKYAKVLKNNKWGFIDENGKEVIKPAYNEISHFYKGIARAKYYDYLPSVNPGWCGFSTSRITITGYINIYGEEVIPFKQYDGGMIFHNDKAVVIKDGKRGVINITGKEVIPCLYDDIRVYDRFTLVKIDDKWGAYNNKSGVLISELIYDEMKWYNEFLLGYVKDKFVILNQKTGKPVNSEIFDATNLDDRNTMGSRIPTNREVLIVKQNDQFFMVNRKGNRISDSYAQIWQKSKNYFMVKNKDKLGLINSKGKLVFNMEYSSIGVHYKDETVFFTRDGDKVVYYNKRFNKIPTPLKNGLGFINIDGKRGYINAKGKLIIPAIYDVQSKEFERENEAMVRKDLKWGVIDRKGEIIIPVEYNTMLPIYQCDFYIVAKDKKTGIIDRQGNIIIPITYQSINTYNNRCNLFTVSQENKWGVIDVSNVTIIPLTNDKRPNDKSHGFISFTSEDEDVTDFYDYRGTHVFSTSKYNSGFDKSGFSITYDKKRKAKVVIDKYLNEVYYNDDVTYKDSFDDFELFYNF